MCSVTLSSLYRLLFGVLYGVSCLVCVGVSRFDEVEWSIDSDNRIIQGMHICSPRTVYFLLVSIVEKLLFNWRRLKVTVFFKESRAVYEALLAHQQGNSTASSLLLSLPSLPSLQLIF